MSGKSARKPVKVTNQVPREMEAIQREAQETYIKAGQVQYHIDVLKQDLARLNSQLLSINHEAAARNELNKTDAAKEPKNEA